MKVKEKIKKSFIDYKLLYYFIFSSIINATMLRCFTVFNYFAVRPFIADLGIIFLLSALSFFIKEKNKNKYFLIVTIISVFMFTVNSMYYTFYKSFASVSLLSTSVFVVDVGDAIVENVVQIKDLVFLWQLIGLIILIRYEKKNKIKDKTYKVNKKLAKKFALSFLVCFLLVVAISKTRDYALFTKEWSRKGMVINFGIYTFQINDIIQSLRPQLNNIFGHDVAYKKTVDFYDEYGYENNDYEENIFTNIFEGKNLIVIHAESLQTIAMEQKFNGKEVTPNLNKLASEGIFFSNFYSQVGVGTSSDAEFTFSTSMMPSSNGTVFVNYYDREYVTIQKLLKEKGYYVFSMHGNDGNFWNRDTMHKNMGYDMYFDKDYYVIDETIGLGLSDESFFRQSTDIIKNIKDSYDGPFYAHLITLTNHTPFSDTYLLDEFDTTLKVNINGQIVERDYINGTVLGNYFRSVHYEDAAIGEFIDELDEVGLLENTVIVIYGDHDARIDEEYYNYFYNYDPYTDTVLNSNDEGYTLYNEYTYELDRKVPFIIWTKDKEYNLEVDTPMGMIDAMPTLGNMFNFHSKYQMGQDIFSVEDNMVVFTDGSYLTDKIYYNAQKEEQFPITATAINEEYITKRSEYADKLIEISNYIITYDLIKEIENGRN